MQEDEAQRMWRARVADYEASGLTQRAWCALNGVAVHQLNYRRDRMKSLAPGQALWCELDLARGADPAARQPVASLRVEVGAASIVVEPGFDAALLRQVVQVLAHPGSSAC